MKKLTESLIQQRLKSCTTNLDKVVQINVTGRGLEDVSLLKKLTGVEVLSFSVNQISSLADFRFCKNLRELYLRKNKISDVEQIYYLKNLPKLKLLMLSDNPCTKDSLYRMTVIKNLKNLVELDGVPIRMEERRQAQKLGKDIWSEDEESIECVVDESQNSQTSKQNLQKLKVLDVSSVSDLSNGLKVSDEREADISEVLEESEENEIQEKDTWESKEAKELKEIIYKETTENKPKDCFKTVHPKHICKFSYSSENDEKQTEPHLKKRIVSRSVNPNFACKFCGSQEPQTIKSIPKNYNLLSAALNIVKELDYTCLQIVNAEVASLLNAYEFDLI